jgi:hypothetical protein
MGKEIRWTLLHELSALPETTLRHSLIELQTTDLLYETSRSPDHVYTFAHILTQEAANLLTKNSLAILMG